MPPDTYSEECQYCAKASGQYDFKKLCCCVRIVRDSRPFKSRQEAMLAVIARTPGAPSREEVLEGLSGGRKAA